MKLAELTSDDGRRIGVPAASAMMIMSLEKADNEANPKAKALIRYKLGPGNVRAAYVRDPFKQVLNLFRVPYSGGGWIHVEDLQGNDLALPEGSIVAYEEIPEAEGVAHGFMVTLEAEGQTTTIALKLELDELRKHMGLEGATPAATEPESEAPTETRPLPGKPRRPKAAD